MNRPLATPLQHFYRTSAQPCPYIPGRTERKVITDLGGHDAIELYNGLSRAGFRRSHQLAYRPACPSCASCLPVRVEARRFEATRWSRRLWRGNADLAIVELPPEATVEQYRLFARYQRMRHADSEMAGMTFTDYRAMVEDCPVECMLLALRDRAGRLLGLCLTDRLDDGLSAVYSFFDPDQQRRSLGTFLVLALIEAARTEGLPYVYLGYWIAESRKMGYKTRFRPLEALGPDGWAPLDFDEASSEA
jgi:leucyl-tRNA---protein transferase